MKLNPVNFNEKITLARLNKGTSSSGILVNSHNIGSIREESCDNYRVSDCNGEMLGWFAGKSNLDKLAKVIDLTR
ncbi:MAG: hypothetical protein A2287_10685 [Candidatus Melainabacteria bacterium RIFOXYA12_FULL_32_12]|nr:MAG: hypothetical protein A2255_01685 [Candidatus Melainabacteria bacterium RIFOXYA2_FULL_32_9]OGI24270.1 MAG: hypothetical protein A2287_10685 [Candidatus Melainabacteria bacterium RIFOXYA12_FULL_32_12]